MRRIIAGSIWLLLIISQGAAAQKTPELFARVEKTFREQEAAWKIEEARMSAPSDPYVFNMVFRSKAGQAAVEMVVWRRKKDAEDTFRANMIVFGRTMGKTKSALPALGDEGYIWTRGNSSAWPTIMFRQGKINVTVFAPSVPIAKRFAAHVFDQLKAEE